MQIIKMCPIPHWIICVIMLTTMPLTSVSFSLFLKQNLQSTPWSSLIGAIPAIHPQTTWPFKLVLHSPSKKPFFFLTIINTCILFILNFFISCFTTWDNEKSLLLCVDHQTTLSYLNFQTFSWILTKYYWYREIEINIVYPSFF